MVSVRNTNEYRKIKFKIKLAFYIFAFYFCFIHFSNFDLLLGINDIILLVPFVIIFIVFEYINFKKIIKYIKCDDFKDYECEFTGYSNNESIRFTKYALNCEFELNDFKVTKITDYVYDYNEICNYVNTEGKIIYSKSLDIVLVVRIKK